MPQKNDRIKHLLKYIERDYCTDKQNELIDSFHEQFEKRVTLSDKQYEILEDINHQAGLRDRPFRR